MRASLWLYKAEESARGRAVAALLLVIWLGLAAFIASRHALWRDEVRALSLALRGSNVFGMLAAIHGDGHPALWYLLLRGAHALVAAPGVLQVVALSVASAAFLLLALRSPFNWPLIALILFTNFALFEYSAMARNYGISMLLLFLLATLYERHRERGITLGVLLFLLANCNAHSVLLVGAFLLFWFVDILDGGEGIRRGPALRTFLLNSAIAALGIAVCFLTIFPPVNDTMGMAKHNGMTLRVLFSDLFPPESTAGASSPRSLLYERLETSAGVFLLIGSTLGLLRRPSTFLAAVLALLLFSAFFGLVYPGSYRHAALWLVFLISMYWIAGSRHTQSESAAFARFAPQLRLLSTIGAMLFLLLVASQVPSGINEIARAAVNSTPFSRSRDLAALIEARPELRSAIIIADPDYLVEPLPYYLPNRTFLMREERFGNVVTFTRRARLRINLADILMNARTLHLKMHVPVVILLAERIDASAPETLRKEGYYWELLSTPSEVRAFRAATRRIASFAPAVSDESYDVYVLN